MTAGLPRRRQLWREARTPISSETLPIHWWPVIAIGSGERFYDTTRLSLHLAHSTPRCG